VLLAAAAAAAAVGAGGMQQREQEEEECCGHAGFAGQMEPHRCQLDVTAGAVAVGAHELLSGRCSSVSDATAAMLVLMLATAACGSNSGSCSDVISTLC